jgi:hypothetical protein
MRHTRILTLGVLVLTAVLIISAVIAILAPYLAILIVGGVVCYIAAREDFKLEEPSDEKALVVYKKNPRS